MTEFADVEMPDGDGDASNFQLGYEWALTEAGFGELRLLAEATGRDSRAPLSIDWQLWPTLYKALRRHGYGTEGQPIDTTGCCVFIEFFVNGAIAGWFEMADHDIVKGASRMLKVGPDDRA